MSEAAKVVAIFGEAIAAPGTVSSELVKFLEETLEKARSGEVVGISGALTSPSSDGYVLPADDFCAGYCDSTAAIGALEYAKFLMLRRIHE